MGGLAESIEYYASMVVERANVELLALALAIYTLSLIFSSLRWLTASRIQYTIANVMGAVESLLVGIFVNNLATFYNITGEVTRVAWASLRLRVGSSRLLVGALAERASEVPVALLYIVFSATPILKLSLVAIPLIAIVKSYVSSMLRALRDLASSPSRLALVLALSLALWLLDTLRIMVVASAFNVKLEFTVALGLTVIHVTSRFSPIPAGLGVLEGGFAGYLKLAGIPLSDSALVILGERLISTIIPTTIGGLIVFYRGGLGILKSAVRGVLLESGYGN